MDEKQLQLLSKQLVTSKDDYMNSLRKNIDLYARMWYNLVKYI